ncbi:hypothetical protein EZJ49_13140 [Bdellovibrio bacteriovorus]|uniref:hypothetical protein n=1 Tax=Bdellovibrio bacteriovorus TaxID=959 RepID=UPI0021CEA004|nr:hypothetical protein [Bdellovibrio bacteriovorus]UXR64009.1 hypothetical protein EZJ49_13140 [Bdellovibrio bacteriovorus]
MAFHLMHLDDFNFDGEPAGSCASRCLSVTDDLKIRTEMFSATASLLKKIRKLEKDHADFLRWDQLLYEDWYNLTFRKERVAGEQLERRYRTLSTFHLHLKHVAETANVSLARAYVLLKEEEHQYQSGDADWKFVIENLRQQRLKYSVHTATKESTATRARLEGHFVTEYLFPADELLGKGDGGLSVMNRQARSMYHYLNDVPDEAMVRHFGDPTAGYELFKESFQIAMKCGDWRLLSRIWKNSSPGYQQKLLKPMPSHLKDFLQQMIGNAHDQERPSYKLVEQELLLRSTYRKLARLLHPDMQNEASSGFQEWSLKMWQKVQVTYKARDAQGLKRLELICMAELGNLSHLTLDEIYESSLIFAEELETLKKNLRSYRKHPAWRFSSRRGYEALTMRIRRELKKRFGPLEAEVKAMEELLKEVSAGEIL